MLCLQTQHDAVSVRWLPWITLLCTQVGGTTHLHGFTCAVGVLRVAPPALEHEGSNHTESSPSA